MKRSLLILGASPALAILLSGVAQAKVMRIHVVDHGGSGVAGATVQLFVNHRYEVQKRTDQDGYTSLEIPAGDVCISASTRKPARSAEVCHNGLSTARGTLLQIRLPQP